MFPLIDSPSLLPRQENIQKKAQVVNNKINDLISGIVQAGSSLMFFSNTCAFPTVTGQNVCLLQLIKNPLQNIISGL